MNGDPNLGCYRKRTRLAVDNVQVLKSLGLLFSTPRSQLDVSRTHSCTAGSEMLRTKKLWFQDRPGPAG